MPTSTLFNLNDPWITQGLLAAWLRCRTEARLFLGGWSPAREASALTYGSLSHEVLSELYARHRRGKFKPGGSAYKMSPAVGRVVRLVGKRWRARNGQGWNPTREQEHELHLAQLETLVPHYLDYWYRDDFVKVKWAAPEQVFTVRMGRYTLTGRIDGARWLGKQLWLFETKNWSMVPEASLLNTLGNDLQMNFYCYALWKITGKEPRGATLNVIRRPGIAVGKKGLDAYMNRLDEHIVKDRDHYFKRYDVPMGRGSVVEFEEELTEMLDEFGAWLRDGMPGYKYGMPCSVRGSLCKFAPMCHHGVTRSYTKRRVLYPELED